MAKLDIKDQYLLKDETQLRQLCGDTTESIWAKASDHISKPMREFIELSPYCCISSCDSKGQTDISPRGDTPGFVNVANPNQLLMPDRPGNRRFDNIRNMLQNPQISLLFMIPGVPITLRVNGTVQISFDPSLLNQFIVQDNAPKMVLIINVEEAYGHCAKAILRGKVWENEYKKSRTEVPTLGNLMTHHLKINEEAINKVNAAVKQDLKDSMY